MVVVEINKTWREDPFLTETNIMMMYPIFCVYTILWNILRILPINYTHADIAQSITTFSFSDG